MRWTKKQEADYRRFRKAEEKAREAWDNLFRARQALETAIAKMDAETMRRCFGSYDGKTLNAPDFEDYGC